MSELKAASSHFAFATKMDVKILPVCGGLNPDETISCYICVPKTGDFNAYSKNIKRGHYRTLATGLFTYFDGVISDRPQVTSLCQENAAHNTERIDGAKYLDVVITRYHFATWKTYLGELS